jgi:fatty-acyl-CoA synthase
MLSTMQDTPMSIGQIVRYCTTAQADSKVVTWDERGPRSISFGELGRRAAQLAHALRSLGIDDDQRVATFMWNNSAHMEAYLGCRQWGPFSTH